MEKQEELRRYYLWRPVEFDEENGYPFGENLFYECQICQQLVPSLPDRADRDLAIECSCGNVIIDADAGRILVSKPNSIKLYKRTR